MDGSWRCGLAMVFQEAHQPGLGLEIRARVAALASCVVVLVGPSSRLPAGGRGRFIRGILHTIRRAEMTERAAPVIAVVGPTAAGKSALAVGLALALGGEVINADSMQLYRGMDIGTAKLTVAERGGVPHHLLDIWDVRQAASVADYQRLARAVIEDIAVRGRVPVLTGGSGLYIRAAVEDLNFPGTDPRVRDRLEAELAAGGPAALHARLAGLDPAAAASILPSNGRRIVRALEVIEISGSPFAATLPAYESSRPAVQIGVRVPRDELDRRITARVDQMWAAGFEQEVRRLERAGLRGRQDRKPRARLRADAAAPGGGVDAGAGARGNRPRDEAVRPPPGILVPPRPPHHLARAPPVTGPPVTRCPADAVPGAAWTTSRTRPSR